MKSHLKIHNNKQEWKPVKGYEGLYEVSSDGVVRSLPRVVRVKSEKHGWIFNKRFMGKVLKQELSNCGYLRAFLYKNGVGKKVSVHRIMAEVFIPNPQNKAEVNHKNGIKTDNRIDNLEWMSSSENSKHSYATGLQTPVRGERHGISILTEDDIRSIRKMYIPRKCTQQRIADLYGIAREHVRDIVNKKRWRHVA